jgi:hypothetical protein
MSKFVSFMTGFPVADMFGNLGDECGYYSESPTISPETVLKMTAGNDLPTRHVECSFYRCMRKGTNGTVIVGDSATAFDCPPLSSSARVQECFCDLS